MMTDNNQKLELSVLHSSILNKYLVKLCNSDPTKSIDEITETAQNYYENNKARIDLIVTQLLFHVQRTVDNYSPNETWLEGNDFIITCYSIFHAVTLCPSSFDDKIKVFKLVINMLNTKDNVVFNSSLKVVKDDASNTMKRIPHKKQSKGWGYLLSGGLFVAITASIGIAYKYFSKNG